VKPRRGERRRGHRQLALWPDQCLARTAELLARFVGGC
jgi:hypothetical protein